MHLTNARIGIDHEKELRPEGMRRANQIACIHGF